MRTVDDKGGCFAYAQVLHAAFLRKAYFQRGVRFYDRFGRDMNGRQMLAIDQINLVSIVYVNKELPTDNRQALVALLELNMYETKFISLDSGDRKLGIRRCHKVGDSLNSSLANISQNSFCASLMNSFQGMRQP